MKLITIGIILLFLVSFIFVIYDFNNNENIKRNYNKFLNKPCELKTYSIGTQIENCAVYKVRGTTLKEVSEE